MKGRWPYVAGGLSILAGIICWWVAGRLDQQATDRFFEASNTLSVLNRPDRTESDESIRRRADSIRDSAYDYRSQADTYKARCMLLLLAGTACCVWPYVARWRAARAEAVRAGNPLPPLSANPVWNIAWLVTGSISLFCSGYYLFIYWGRLHEYFWRNLDETLTCIVFGALGFRWVLTSVLALVKRPVAYRTTFAFLPLGAVVFWVGTYTFTTVYWTREEARLWRELQEKPGNVWNWTAYDYVPGPWMRPEYFSLYTEKCPEFLAPMPETWRLEDRIREIDYAFPNHPVAQAAKAKIEAKIRNPNAPR